MRGVVSGGEAERLTGVRVCGVSRLFGATPALRGIHLAFQAGTVTLLAGPNGAGKSTLLSIVGTQLSPSRGEVIYSSGASERLSLGTVRAQLGWVSHESHCYRELSGRQNVELAARLYGVDPEKAWTEVSERVGLGRYAERAVSTFSRGQRQRVALARALVHQPSLLLLDEPWTGLDASSSAQLERIVSEERDRGAVVVVVSHASGLAERLGARTVQLTAGRIVTKS